VSSAYVSPGSLSRALSWLVDEGNWQDVPLVASPYGALFLKGSHSVLYHTLTMKKIFGGKELLGLWHFFSLPGGTLFASLPDDLKSADMVRILVGRGFLVPRGDDWCRPLKDLRARALSCSVPFSPLTVVAGGSPAPAPGADVWPVTGDLEQFLVHAAHRGIRAPGIRILVGAGSSALAMLRSLLPWVRHVERERVYPFDEICLQVSVHSSAVTDDLAALLGASGVNVEAFWDGGGIYSNRSLFDASLLGYRNLVKKGLRPSISSPVSLETVPGLQGLAEFFAFDLEAPSITFLFPGACNKAPGEPLPAGIAGPLMFRIFERLRLAGIVMEPLYRKARAFACEEPLVWQPDSPSTARERLPLFRDSCCLCPALAICGGSCHAGPVEGSLGWPAPGECRFNLLMLQWLIDETARAMKLVPGGGSFILFPGGAP